MLVQKGIMTKSKEIGTTAGVQNQCGAHKDIQGKLIICFCCGGNHPILECNDICIKEREKIMATNNTEWAKFMTTKQAVRVREKQKVEGQVHM